MALAVGLTMRASPASAVGDVAMRAAAARAHDPAVATCPPADITVGRIGELLACDLPALLGANAKGGTT